MAQTSKDRLELHFSLDEDNGDQKLSVDIMTERWPKSEHTLSFSNPKGEQLTFSEPKAQQCRLSFENRDGLASVLHTIAGKLKSAAEHLNKQTEFYNAWEAD